MEKQISLSAPLKRISVLDALRGFALFGVIIMHMLQRFGIRFGGSQEVLRFPALDEAAQWIGINIIMGRFINIFAFLFGMSFFIQMERASKKGIDFRRRFVWRMIILMVMGLLCHSFYNLEIISLYAFFGLLLIPLYKVKNWVLIVIFSFFLLGGPRAIKVIHHNYKTSIELASAEDDLPGTEDQSNNEGRRNDFQRPRELPEHIKNPSFWNSAKNNYESRLMGKINYQFGLIGRGFVTFGLFVLGLFIGRIRFFEKLAEQKKQNTKLFIGFVIATTIAILIKNALPPIDFRMLFRPDGQILPPSLLTVQAMEDISMVLSSAALTLGFILLYQSGKIGKYLEVLAPYGRTGLSNYIMQGFLGALIFAPWAFGSIFGGLGSAALFLFGIVIYIIQGIISKYWLKYYLYGPLEWLWRSLTYLQFQPYKKKKE